MTYLDKVLHLYPDIQGVMYWHSDPETGEPWTSDKEAYEKGLIWNNAEIERPRRATLDALKDEDVIAAAAARSEQARKASRDASARTNPAVLAGLYLARQTHSDISLSAYLDQLETLPI
jgi:hypothetical protein